MNKEEGFTLMELLVTLVILGIVFAMVVPVFTQSNRSMDGKLFLSQFESIYQKAVNDAITESSTTELEFGSDGYNIISPKPNREVKYLEQVKLKNEDVGKKIKIDQNGKVLSLVEVTFLNGEKENIIKVEPGYQNIYINGTQLSILKND